MIIQNFKYSPILLFTYKRLETLELAVEALKKNYLAPYSDLHIFSDAAKSETERVPVQNVRNYINTIHGFRNISIYEAPVNKGLACSIIDGVSQVINYYGKVIVIEDDLITSMNFLNFMNQALDIYEKNPAMFSIAGYTPTIRNPSNDVYFTKRASSWGWATWNDRWSKVDWELKDIGSQTQNKIFRRSFNRMGSDMYKMLNDQMHGKINSWAIRWCYNQFLSDQYTVFPTISKVHNVGTGSDATHTRDKFNRFKTILDVSDKTDFAFRENIQLETYYLRQFLKQFNILTRIKYKLLNKFRF